MYDIKNFANARRTVRFGAEVEMENFVDRLQNEDVTGIKDTFDLSTGTEFGDGYFYVSFVCTGDVYTEILNSLKGKADYESAAGWDYYSI